MFLKPFLVNEKDAYLFKNIQFLQPWNKIVGLFDVLPNFCFTTNETKYNY